MDTKTREATQVSAELPTTVYCIRHERTVKAEQGANGLRHAEGDWKEEVEFCYFPDGLTYCPPPVEYPYDIPHDWAAEDISEEERELAELEEIGEWLESWTPTQ